jgi:branched-subunit amino acid ABC-type transport system permease component
LIGQQLANGLVLGSIYALAALGFTLIFGAARVVNFAYGEVLMLGAFLTLTLMQAAAGIGFFVALPLAMLATAGLSVVLYLLVVRPVLRTTDLRVLLVTTGLLYMLREAAILIWGTSWSRISACWSSASCCSWWSRCTESSTGPGSARPFAPSPRTEAARKRSGSTSIGS